LKPGRETTTSAGAAVHVYRGKKAPMTMAVKYDGGLLKRMNVGVTIIGWTGEKVKLFF